MKQIVFLLCFALAWAFIITRLIKLQLSAQCKFYSINISHNEPNEDKSVTLATILKQ